MMQLASYSTRTPNLVQTLEALSQRADYAEAADVLIHELSGITALVARKFTNDKTADGLLEAFYLTVGCVSLGLSQAAVDDDLFFLLEHGAEQVFQSGFRAIRELSALPAQTMLTDFDNDAFIQQRDIKALFIAICRANPSMVWTGDDDYRKEMLARRENQTVVECARWLRKKHYAGPIKESDLDANAVIAIAVIFAILNDGRIVARVRQKDIESLIRRARENKPDVETGWGELLSIAPPEYHAVLRERMDEFKDKIVKKILSRSSIVKVVTEIQNCYAGSEQEIDYH
jgi:hypothetical protein